MTIGQPTTTEGSDRDRVQPVERVCLSVEEVGRVLGIGRNSAYEAVRRGQIPALRIGGRYLVPKRALERILDAPSVSVGIAE